MSRSLPKSEIMRGEKGVARLFSDGKWGFCYPFRYIFRVVDGADAGGNGGIGVAECGNSGETEDRGHREVKDGNDDGLKGGSGRETENGDCRLIKCGGEGVKALFSVPKRNHKRAVARNLLKRRTREAYRLNKAALCGKAAETGKRVELAIIYSSKESLDYRTINNGVRRILAEIMGRL